MKNILVFLFLATTVLLPAPGWSEGATASSDVVYTIPIRGMIEPALLYVIRRGVNEAESVDAKAIIFVMDTPGGTLQAASDIVRTIQKIKVPTYTFVEKDAFSAGAIIAMATKHIYMAPGTVIGDAMPIMMTPWGGAQEMPEDLKEKAVSAVAALVRSAAEEGGHNKELAEKMVRRELEFKIGSDVISPAGQLLTLTNVEAERKVGKDKKPLLSEGTFKNVSELLKAIGLESSSVKELQVTTIEKVARYIAALAPIFLIIGLLGLYIEFKLQGSTIIPGVVGVICLMIFFWGHHIAGLAGMEDILIFMLGMALLVVELLFIPGFGFVGFLGIGMMLWALFDAMVEKYPGGPWYPAWPAVQMPLFKLSISLIGSAVAAMLIGKYLPETRLFKNIGLETTTSRKDGYAASDDLQSLIGLEGRALSPLRPAGSSEFGGQKLDVVTRGDYLASGTPIRVVETHGNRIIVEAVSQKPS
jgi:membrane-bound serine protease (ClpP class)